VRIAQFDETELRSPRRCRAQRESEWTNTFVPPLENLLHVPADYDIQKSGSSTIAAGGLAIYTRARERHSGWANSVLQPGMTMGRVYRVKLSEDGRSAVGENEELFRTANRYRDIAIGPDQHTFYLVHRQQRPGPNDGSVWRKGHDLCQSRIRAPGKARLVAAAQQEDHKE
jgi:hypothetical protein